jgi:hypothetical protein
VVPAYKIQEAIKGNAALMEHCDRLADEYISKIAPTPDGYVNES